MKTALYLFFLMTLARPSAQSPTSAEIDEGRVMALENAWNQAVQMGESKPLQPMLVDGLIYIDYDGKLMNKGEYLAHVGAPSMHPEHIANESMHAQAYGNSVVVTGIYHEKGSKKGQPYELRERFVDAWIQQNGMWVCVSSQSTPISRAK